MTKSVLRMIPVVVAAAILVYISAVSLPTNPSIDSNITIATLLSTPQVSVVEQPDNIDELPFRDNPEVYMEDDPSSMVTIYVTVKKDSSLKSNYTWEQVNEFVNELEASQAVKAPRAEVLVQFGDESGPLPGEVGYGEAVANGTIEVRGATPSFSPQKSYQIKLFDSAGTWRGQSTINLNKHFRDGTRYRNKLSFDLLKDIPDMVSLRTQFVHLYVLDETSDPAQTKYVDYGLFTQVEQPNKRFLASRYLDPDGQLYKANNFEFFRYSEQFRLATDPEYDEDVFAQHLEIKGNKDHAKLITMLDDVNNEEIPIEQTFEHYFNSDNYFTWLAFNILVGNIDTRSQNFFLFSPKNGDKWYFMPWDYDGAFPLQNQPDLKLYEMAPWENGVSNYWGVVLHRRVLKVEAYRGALSEKMDELRSILTPGRINQLIRAYRPVVEKYAFAMPDMYYLPATMDTFQTMAGLIPQDIEENYTLYEESLKKPMPFKMGVPNLFDGKLTFTWEEAYDFNGQKVSYHFLLGRDWAFSDILFEKISGEMSIQIEQLEPGEYFWAVTATNESGYVQYPFDSYIDIDSLPHPGVQKFYVSPDGEVLK